MKEKKRFHLLSCSEKTLTAGFGIIEIIVAMAIFVIIAVSGVSTVVHTFTINRLGKEETKAVLYSQEGIEAARSIKNQAWSNLVVGTYGLDNSGGSWAFSGSSDTLGEFTRTVAISEVQRGGGGCGDIVESGGTVDPDTFKVLSEVTWDFTPARPNSVGLTSYLANWKKSLPAGNGVAYLTGDRTTNGINLNLSTPYAIEWSTSDLDTGFFSYSAGTPTRLVIESDGDYLIALTLPLTRTDIQNRRTRIESEIRVNGSKVNVGVGRSSYIRSRNNHNESSSHLSVLLRNLSQGDYIEVFVSGIAQLGAPYVIEITGQASFYAENIGLCQPVFSATATRTTSGPNLNSTPATLEWAEGRKGVGFTHSDSASSQNITINDIGDYLVFVNVPLAGTVSRASVIGRVLLDGSQVAGGEFKQGYIRNSNSDTESSIHWSGVVRTISADQVLTASVEKEAGSGTITVGSDVATIYVQKLPPQGIYFGRGNNLTNGTNWNPASAGDVEWVNDDIIDGSVFSHDTGSSPEVISVSQNGDYLLTYNDSLTATSGKPNAKIVISINGTPLTGAETKTHYIAGSAGHNESSASLTYLLNNLSAGDAIRVNVSREADTDTMNDTDDAILLLWLKE